MLEAAGMLAQKPRGRMEMIPSGDEWQLHHNVEANCIVKLTPAFEKALRSFSQLARLVTLLFDFGQTDFSCRRYSTQT